MDKRQALLAENENKRLTIKLPLLICFAMFNAWQMGVGYYSGQSLSIDGRTPLPVDVGDLTVLIVAGYLLSIAVMLFLPNFIVRVQRITVGVALLSALMLFLPFSPEALSMFYRLHYFCGCFLIGFETALIVNLFTEKTAVLHTTVAYAATLTIPALLQNDFFHIPFWIFRLVIVISCAMQLYFFCKLPGKSWPRYTVKSDGLICPKNFFTGVYFLEGLTALMTFFALTIAETITHGLFILFISSIVYWLAVYYLWKHHSISPIRCVSILIVLAAIGFVLAIVSLYYPSLSPLACALLGAGYSALIIQPLYGVLMAKRYPSRYIAPGFIGLCFIAILIHTVLLEILRDRPALMYMVYLVIALVITVLFFVLMPYLLYNFRSRTLKDIIGVVAEETEEEAAELENAPVKRATGQRAALLVKTETVKPVVNEDEPLHDKRMKILMTHALSPLTNREYQLADCIMRGLRRSEIAQEMGIEPESITKCSNRIYNKFAIHRRQDLYRQTKKLEREWPEE
jgi:DNA-binding NarL/FixJ family response regulator